MPKHSQRDVGAGERPPTPAQSSKAHERRSSSAVATGGAGSANPTDAVPTAVLASVDRARRRGSARFPIRHRDGNAWPRRPSGPTSFRWSSSSSGSRRPGLSSLGGRLEDAQTCAKRVCGGAGRARRVPPRHLEPRPGAHLRDRGQPHTATRALQEAAAGSRTPTVASSVHTHYLAMATALAGDRPASEQHLQARRTCPTQIRSPLRGRHWRVPTRWLLARRPVRCPHAVDEARHAGAERGRPEHVGARSRARCTTPPGSAGPSTSSIASTCSRARRRRARRHRGCTCPRPRRRRRIRRLDAASSAFSSLSARSLRRRSERGRRPRVPRRRQACRVRSPHSIVPARSAPAASRRRPLR